MALQQEEPRPARSAQRAGEITTRSGPAACSCAVVLGPAELGAWVLEPAGPQPNDERTGSWQMLEPRTDTSCDAFGRMFAEPVQLVHGRKDPGGDYQFNLWRPYTCAVADAGIFIRAIP